MKTDLLGWQACTIGWSIFFLLSAFPKKGFEMGENKMERMRRERER